MLRGYLFFWKVLGALTNVTTFLQEVDIRSNLSQLDQYILVHMSYAFLQSISILRDIPFLAVRSSETF
jgi:hypothetical protein